MIDTLLFWIAQYGYIALFLLLMLGIVGLPIPDECLLTGTGYLVCLQVLRPFPTICAALLGSICGITLSYFLGRTFGFPLIERYGRFINLKMRHVEKVRQWFQRIGKWTLTVGYFCPGVRHFTGFVAGTSKLQLKVFAGYAYLGALLWATTFISLGYFLGESWMEKSIKIHLYLVMVGVFLVILVCGYFLLWQKFIKPVTSK